MNRRLLIPPLVILAAACRSGEPASQTAASITMKSLASRESPPGNTESTQPSRPLVDARPLSLKQMIDQADRIFVGVVADLSEAPTPLTQSGQTVTVNVLYGHIHRD